MKKILTYGLLGLAVVGIGFAVKNRVVTSGPVPTTAPGAGEVSTLPDDGVVVTYFTTDVRCPTCHKIEDLTRQTVENRFADALASGHLVFQTINTDQPGNRHYVDDYRLVSKTVIVSQRKGGEETDWQNLQEVWMKVSSPDDFQAYIQAGVEASLNPVSPSGA